MGEADTLGVWNAGSGSGPVLFSPLSSSTCGLTTPADRPDSFSVKSVCSDVIWCGVIQSMRRRISIVRGSQEGERKMRGIGDGEKGK
jgi:hypothetical protein